MYVSGWSSKIQGRHSPLHFASCNGFANVVSKMLSYNAGWIPLSYYVVQTKLENI